jgi:hypothetical protein
MNCGNLKELLSAYADGELARTQKDFIEEHLAGCADCRATLARYHETGEKLRSLHTMSRSVDIKDATMSSIKVVSLTGKPRRWLRPALAGGAAIIVICILAIIFALPGQSPEDVLAKAVANTEALNSYRIAGISEVRLPESIEWLIYSYGEAEYAGSGKFHGKTRMDLDYNDGILDNWKEREFVFSDNVIYTWSTMAISASSRDYILQVWDEETTRIQQPVYYLKFIPDINRLPDAEIDGTACFHYKGMVDMDAWMEDLLSTVKPVWREQRRQQAELFGTTPDEAEIEEQIEQLVKTVRAQYKPRQFEYELWIGKDDYLLHQITMEDTLTPEAKAIMPISTDKRGTSKFYDFNAEIMIKPPLDEEGNLLPGWRIQEE